MKHFVFGLQVLHLRNIANCFHVHVLLSLTEKKEIVSLLAFFCRFSLREDLSCF